MVGEYVLFFELFSYTRSKFTIAQLWFSTILISQKVADSGVMLVIAEYMYKFCLGLVSCEGDKVQ